MNSYSGPSLLAFSHFVVGSLKFVTGKEEMVLVTKIKGKSEAICIL